MEWFKHWFNSEEYLKVYKHRDEKDAEELVNLVLNSIQLNPGDNILDMAAGFGRHAILFAKKGFKVSAVDLSENLLSIAQNNAEKEGANIEFIQSDIRHFTSAKKYNLIINLFTSIGYFESDDENYNILKNAFELLKDGGFFVLDYFNKNFVKKNLVAQTIDEVDDSIITQNRFIEGERIIKEITVERKGKTNKFYESVRMFSKEELIGVMENLGFKIIKIFGDFSGKPFELDFSPRIIIIAFK